MGRLMTRRPAKKAPVRLSCPAPPFEITRRIFLTGMMAAGKTTAGRLLAETLEWPFIDTDAWVEKQAGMSIKFIFERYGETHFRRLEREALAAAAEQPRAVVSTGGGVVLASENRRLMRETGTVVYLDITLDVLARRVAAGGGERPLLSNTVEGMRERLNELWQMRRSAYRDADLWLDADQWSPPVIVARLVETLGLDSAAGGAAALAGAGGSVSPGPVPRRRVDVQFGVRTYPVWVGSGLLDRAGELLNDLRNPRRALIVTDQQISDLYATRAAAALEREGIRVATLSLPSGEATKSLEHLSRIYDAAVTAELERSDVMVAVGGGVIGDAAGFAAATYLRGLDWVQVPTTLLAQVDASVGGKTGINHPQGKNLIGSFHQPLMVLADTAVLATLSLREWRSGLAEVAKHAILAGGPYLDFVEQHSEALAAPAIGSDALVTALVTGSVALKARVVSADEHEGGLRAVLNLGHTVGHALEAAQGYQGLTHGEAVAVGIAAAARLAAGRGLLAAQALERIENLLTGLALPVRMPAAVTAVALLNATTRDKKRQAGRLRWILPHDLGVVDIHDDVPESDITAVLRFLGAS
ncbi:MAG: 3-dehydroquinate synthase [Thermaerobacterales bacterium]